MQSHRDAWCMVQTTVMHYHMYILSFSDHCWAHTKVAVVKWLAENDRGLICDDKLSMMEM
jgi:hypothetical protein